MNRAELLRTAGDPTMQWDFAVIGGLAHTAAQFDDARLAPACAALLAAELGRDET